MNSLKRTLPLLALLVLAAPAARAEMTVHVINVGQAESILLQFSNDLVLIDAGSELSDTDDYAADLLDYLGSFFEQNPQYRLADGRGRFHSVIVSHPHIDHTRNLLRVLDKQKFKVRNLVYGGGQGGSGWGELKDAIALAKQTPRISRRVINAEYIGAEGYQPAWLANLKTSSDADLRFLSGYRGGACEDENNDSLTLRVEHKGVKLLFTGDAETEDQWCVPQVGFLLDRFEDTLLDVDVYKVGHHASRNGTSRTLMEAMTPQVALISAGHHSTRTADPDSSPHHAFFYGHPRELIVKRVEALTSLNRAPVTVYTMEGQEQLRENRRVEKAVYCTCWDGHIKLVVKDDGRLAVNGADL